MERKAFFMKPKRQCHLCQRGEWVCGAQSWKKKKLLCESMFVRIDKRILTLKNGGKRSFSYETKASKPFIPISRMNLWCASWKEKILLCNSKFVPIETRSLIPKIEGKRRFFYKTKDPMSFVLTRKMSLWCSIMKKKEIIMWICVCPKWQMNFKSKKWWKEKFFLWN